MDNFGSLLIIGGNIANSRCYPLLYQIMGKKQRKEQNYTTAQTFRIHKNKSLSSNLNDYIRFLKSKFSHLSTKQYLSLIHKYIFKLKQKGNLSQSLVVQTAAKIKICKKCDKWAIGTKKMIQCLLCQDYYHYECAQNYSGDQDWGCENCNQILQKWEKQNGIEKKVGKAETCSKCCKNKNQISIKCLKCFKFFHKSCYGGSHVVCKDCNSDINKNIEEKQKQKQLTLRQSFKKAQTQSQRKRERKRNFKQQENKKDQESTRSSLKLFGRGATKYENQKNEEGSKNEINESTSSSIFSTLRRFKSPFPKMSEQEIENYRRILLYAILSKNMQYTQDLYCHNCKLEIDNEDSVDFALTHLSMSDLKMFKQYKKQPIGPFLLEYKEKCGYDVVADKNLPKGMIVCQYVGDVYTNRDRINLPGLGDSTMQLKKGKNADQSLLIVPTNYTNIARFINGVNQSDAQKKKKQNVETVRYLVNGRPAVILYTCKQVKKGQSLLYNYGAGLNEKKYDTSYYE